MWAGAARKWANAYLCALGGGREGEAIAQHAPNGHESARTPALNPAALTVEDAARLLAAAGGGGVSAAMIRADIDAGAPTNADGTVNLVQYAAWLARALAEMNRGGGAIGGD